MYNIVHMYIPISSISFLPESVVCVFFRYALTSTVRSIFLPSVKVIARSISPACIEEYTSFILSLLHVAYQRIHNPPSMYDYLIQ